MLRLNYQYRIYPDAEQAITLCDWLETSRRVYNYALRQIKDWSNSRKCPIDRCSIVSEYVIPPDEPYPSEYKQNAELAKAKKTNPRLKAVPAQNLQCTIKQLHKGFDFMRERGFGYPRFKKPGKLRSTLFPQFKTSPLDAQNNVIKLPKLGKVTINLHRPIPDGFKIKNVRVIKKADHWYCNICIQCDVNVPSVGFHGHAIGVDLGLDYLVATSDSLQVKRPRFKVKAERKLKLLQRRLNRKQKGSANYRKAQLKVARLHRTVAAQRRDHHYKLAHQLLAECDSIFFEDIDFRTMAKGMLGKHTLDAGLGELRQITKTVALKLGKFFDTVDHRGTSQECPDCGVTVKKTLADRIHRCDNCCSVKPRDVASAQVICNRGIAKHQTLPVEHRELETA
ncbi:MULTISPECIES: RNA-guided endonuclease TnpB family protein [Moorena]|nr:RNA-guided endonuclease TnpB family protein [Moorena producens]NEP36344.1 transposase [Moorena sp. SIO3B2]NEP67250.1 transposase [Moorena sp. SIO3A5]NEQ10845.1 transposase [Moorena sp. SIO4E2]NES44351.1 transposase [Moorena sp. SIO2C4]NET65735.1 transposase [Moorena sp. SIO1G6]